MARSAQGRLLWVGLLGGLGWSADVRAQPASNGPAKGEPTPEPAVGPTQAGQAGTSALEPASPVAQVAPAQPPLVEPPRPAPPPTGAPSTDASEVFPLTSPAMALVGQPLLQEAERAMLEIDYERSLTLAQQAIARGSLARDELRRAYIAVAISAAQLDRQDRAQPAFLKLFALDPNYDFARRLAPARRSSAITARNYWLQRREPMTLAVNFDRDSQQLSVTCDDPLGWLRKFNVWVRTGPTPFEKHVVPATGTARLDLATAPSGTLEVYVEALDSSDNVVLENGSATQPQRFEPATANGFGVDREIRGGEPGSFGTRLSEWGSNTSLQGYTSLELGPRPAGEGATFDLAHATVFFKSTLLDVAALELGVDIQHLTASRESLTVPHAFLDLELGEWLGLRPGFFEAPVGAFNEYLYPDFLRTSASVPLFATVVVPGLWSELGVQARGRVLLESQVHFTYAVFVSNGLEQFDASVGDGEVAEGGDLGAMRFNVRDRYSSDKAVGGRLGFQAGGFDIGASGYTGRYTVDAHRRLSIADVDVSYRSRWVSIRAEGAAAFQQVTRGRRTKTGAYVNVSSRAEPHLEPYVQYDIVDDEQTLQRLLLGNAVYPFPEHAMARTLRVKSEIGFEAQPSRDADLVWLIQLVSGF